jgi:hypothetical protein
VGGPLEAAAGLHAAQQDQRQAGDGPPLPEPAGRPRGRPSESGRLCCLGGCLPVSGCWACRGRACPDDRCSMPGRVRAACHPSAPPLLGRLLAAQVRSVIWRLFELCPTPEAAAAADESQIQARPLQAVARRPTPRAMPRCAAQPRPAAARHAATLRCTAASSRTAAPSRRTPCCHAALQSLIQPLGLYRKRAAAIRRFSDEYSRTQVRTTSCRWGPCQQALPPPLHAQARAPPTLRRRTNGWPPPRSGPAPPSCTASASTQQTPTTCSAAAPGASWHQTTRICAATTPGWWPRMGRGRAWSAALPLRLLAWPRGRMRRRRAAQGQRMSLPRGLRRWQGQQAQRWRVRRRQQQGRGRAPAGAGLCNERCSAS